MTFEIELNGRTRSVSIERAGDQAGRFRVTVDGRASVVDVQRFGDYGISLVFPDDSYGNGAVQLAPSSTRGELLAHLSGRTVAVVVNGRRSGHASGEAAGVAHGEQKLSAPMPGRVVRVLVSPGDEVTARQPLVVVEAMKMENELRSPKTGRVKEVAVSVGASVEAGRLLVTVE